MNCPDCGVAVPAEARYCGHCGATAPSPERAPVDPKQEWFLRGWATAVFLVPVYLMYLDRLRGFSILLLPITIGCLVPMLRLVEVSAWLLGSKEWLERGAAKAKSWTGKIGRYLAQPFFAVSLWSTRKTEAVSDPHIRAGARLAGALYVVGIFALFAIVAAYIVVAIVVFIIAIIVIGWLLSVISSSSSSRGYSYSRREKDWLGDPKTVHYDADGRKAGESREEKGWLGDPKTVHYDTDGRKVGESREEKDWLGDPKTVQHDADGRKAGESREEKDWLGDPKTVHYDTDGRKVGESREEKDWLGDPKTVHYDKDGN
jgi:hypothetical protein